MNKYLNREVNPLRRHLRVTQLEQEQKETRRVLSLQKDKLLAIKKLEGTLSKEYEYQLKEKLVFNMTTPESLLKVLTDREYDLSRRRTRALATQQWAKVIEIEARLEEIKVLKKAVVNEEIKNAPKITETEATKL